MYPSVRSRISALNLISSWELTGGVIVWFVFIVSCHCEEQQLRGNLTLRSFIYESFVRLLRRGLLAMTNSVYCNGGQLHFVSARPHSEHLPTQWSAPHPCMSSCASKSAAHLSHFQPIVGLLQVSHAFVWVFIG